MGSGASTLDNEQVKQLEELRSKVTRLEDEKAEQEKEIQQLARKRDEPDVFWFDDERYIKQRTIGKGASAVCFAVSRESDAEQFVVKQLQVDLTELSQKQGFADEVSVLARFNHPSIIKLYDSYIEDDVLHILMEFASGGTLSEHISRAAESGQFFQEEQILKWFVETMVALKHVHDHKVLHRDVTTRNIFLTEGGHVKLGDFGISKQLSTQTAFASTVIGTPNYLSPEIWQGKAYDVKSDIWSLGCVLSEMSSLRKTFTKPDIPSMMAAIQNCDYTPVPDVYSEVLKTLVESILQPDPNDRPSIEQLMTVPCLMPYIQDIVDRVGVVALGELPTAPAPPRKSLSNGPGPPTGGGGPRLKRRAPPTGVSGGARQPPPPRGARGEPSGFIRRAAASSSHK